MALRPVIEIEIGELALHGFAPDARAPLAGALAAELERLVSERPALVTELHGEQPLLRLASPGPLVPGEPETVGVTVARAIAAGWAR
jgi:hypothetical protein